MPQFKWAIQPCDFAHYRSFAVFVFASDAFDYRVKLVLLASMKSKVVSHHGSSAGRRTRFPKPSRERDYVRVV